MAMNIVADEQQPLLTCSTLQDPDNASSVKRNEVLLDFEDGDDENPVEWTVKFKWFIVLLLATLSFTVYYPTPLKFFIAAQY
jgi:hypothetical protein